MVAAFQIFTMCLATGTVPAVNGGAAKTWSEPVRFHLGSDSNACAILAPGKSPLVKGGSVKKPLYLWLHGGMRSQKREKGWTAYEGLLPFVNPGSAYLASPSAYAGSDWLSPEGLSHIEALLDHLEKNTKADLSNWILVGVSDGCLGALRYVRDGKRKPGKVVLISVLPQLVTTSEELKIVPAYREDSRITWEIFQGEKDRLFSSEQTFPILQEWANRNHHVHLHLEKNGEHDFSWWVKHSGRELHQVFSLPP